MKIDFKIQSVTVFKDRALVESIAKPDLKQGECTVETRNLPFSIDLGSIKVNGSKNAILQDIKIKDKDPDEDLNKEKEERLEEIEKIELQITEINDKIINTNREKEFLSKLFNVQAKLTEKSNLSWFEPEKLTEILHFYNEKLNALDVVIREFNENLKKLNSTLSNLKHKNNKLDQKQLKAEKQIELKLSILDEEPVILVLSYIVMNASWTPVYDLLLDSEEKKLKVAYNAIVRQITGEKWEEVELKLSTARPHVSANPPLIYPWYISIFNYTEAPMALSSSGAGISNSAKRSFKMKEADEEQYIQEPLQIQQAEVETGATSELFLIPNPCTITDNNDEHKVGITTLELTSKLEYTTLPKISPFAYLTSSTTNNSEYPLLPGKTNIFLDNSFVANSSINRVAPNEEFKTSLGIDEGIKVEHKLINKFTKDEGLFGKKYKITYEYLIEIKNTKKIEAVIKIKDQIPISQNQEIKIELIEPRYKEDTELLRKGIDGCLEWTQILKPDEEIKIGLKFSIEYPKEIALIGI